MESQHREPRGPKWSERLKVIAAVASLVTTIVNWMT
jgi:hypothetical protein